jgi:hypothetical protein
VKEVWPETSSAEVARAFVLTFRVMRLIIVKEGNNSWLAHGAHHCNVRQDYSDTTTGICPIERYHNTSALLLYIYIYNLYICTLLYATIYIFI